MERSIEAKNIIAKNLYMILATVSSSGEPWNAPVFFAYDNEYHFYWGSYEKTQHSVNVEQNGKAYMVIFDSTVAAGFGVAVYVRAVVQRVSDEEEIKQAHKLLWDRHTVPYWKLEQFTGTAPIHMYKAVLENVWMNGEGRVDGHYVDTREEIKLV